MYLADNYDGAILDIMMPKMDGITVLKNIHAQGNNVPVLILTASSILKVGNLSLDCTTFELKSPTDAIRLPNKEFQIMELLAANPVQEGPGIGLSVAQAIVQAHKGKITAENKTGNGLTITVLL